MAVRPWNVSRSGPEERQKEEKARRLVEENANRERALAKQRQEEEEACRLAEENARCEQELAEQKRKEEEARLKAGTMNMADWRQPLPLRRRWRRSKCKEEEVNIAALAAVAAAKKTLEKE